MISPISFLSLMFALAYSVKLVLSGTSITVSKKYITFLLCNSINKKVTNLYKKEVNIKIQGVGVGGCDILLQPGETNSSDCWCLWGTINYSFCSYVPTSESFRSNNTNELIVSNGKCPVVTGESLLCSDLSSLGNCYDGAYSCVIDDNGLCGCNSK